jgi:hypothetical protein
MPRRERVTTALIRLTFLFGLCGVEALAGPGEASRVGQWDRFEREVRNENAYANPWRDVTLEVSYAKPDGSTIRFWGFHDGGRTWKIRFMPDQVGPWRYKAEFSDGSPGVEGTFECVSSAIPGMLCVHEENPIWFEFRGGPAIVVRSFHIGDRFFADGDNAVTGETWSARQRTVFLDWAQGQGYNMLSVASHYLNRDSKGRGRGWNTPDLWDAKRDQPNPAEYQRMERVLDDLAARRVLVYPFAGFFGRDSDFPRDPTLQDLYIRYTLARLAPYRNILLVVGGPEPRLKNAPYLTVEEIHRLGRRIASLDVFGHPLSVHNPTGDDEFRDADWSSYGILQGPKTRNRKQLSDGLLRNHHGSKPLYAQETLWAGNQYHPQYSLDDLRKNAWVLLMSATAINFGDMNGNSSSGFSGTLDLTEKVQVRHDVLRKVWDFFETIPFGRMQPRQDLVDNGYCLAEPGRQYLVYLERPGSVRVAVEAGPYDIRWINAQDTNDVRQAGVMESGGPLASPQEGDDWLLYLTHRDG